MRTLGTRRAMARSSARLGDLRQPQAGFELDFELGDDRAGLDFDDFDVEAEVEERLFQDLGLAADFLLVLLVADFLAGEQQVDRRQLVLAGPPRRGWPRRAPSSPLRARSSSDASGVGRERQAGPGFPPKRPRRRSLLPRRPPRRQLLAHLPRDPLPRSPRRALRTWTCRECGSAGPSSSSVAGPVSRSVRAARLDLSASDVAAVRRRRSCQAAPGRHEHAQRPGGAACTRYTTAVRRPSTLIGQDVGAGAGEVHLQQAAAGSAQVSARPDHRSRRPAADAQAKPACVMPTSDSSQPTPRRNRIRDGRRASSQASSTASDTTR